MYCCFVASTATTHSLSSQYSWLTVHSVDVLEYAGCWTYMLVAGRTMVQLLGVLIGGRVQCTFASTVWRELACGTYHFVHDTNAWVLVKQKQKTTTKITKNQNSPVLVSRENLTWDLWGVWNKLTVCKAVSKCSTVLLKGVYSTS